MRQEDRINLALKLILSDLFKLHYWRFMKYPIPTDTSEIDEVTRDHELATRVALKEIEKYRPLFADYEWGGIERNITSDTRVAYLAYKDIVEGDKKGGGTQQGDTE